MVLFYKLKDRKTLGIPLPQSRGILVSLQQKLTNFAPELQIKN